MTTSNQWMKTPVQQQQAGPSGDDDTILVPVEPSAPEAQPEPKSSGRTFTAEEIERARQQEKDKLYPRLSAMEAELKAFRDAQEAERKRAEEAAAAAAAERKAREEAEMSAKDLIAAKEREWNDRFSQLQQEAEQTRAILEQERRYAEIMAYRNQRVEEERDNIIPQLIDFVQGNTPEEIEHSIAVLRERSAAIFADVAQANQQPPAQPVVGRGTNVTAPPVGPMENQSEYQTLTPDQIRDMDMNEYAKLRQRVLPRSATTPQGIFGGGRY